MLADSPAAKWFQMRVDEVADEMEGEVESKSMWDGGLWEDEEDMSMEMVTELGEEEVDPEEQPPGRRRASQGLEDTDRLMETRTERLYRQP